MAALHRTNPNKSNNRNVDRDLKLFRRSETIDNSNAKIDEDCELMQIFKPLTNVLKILGSWPKNAESLIQRFSPWDGISLFVFCLYILEILVKFIINIKDKKSIFHISLEIAAILRAFVVILTLIIRFAKHQRVLKVYKEMNDFPTFNQEYKVSNLSKTIKKIMICYFVFIAIHCILSIDALLKETSDSYINLIFHKLQSDSRFTALDGILMFFNSFCYSFFIICNECLIQIHFLCVCLILRNKIRDFNLFLHHLEHKKSVCSAEQVQQIYRLHSNLTTIVEGIEENFSFQSFLWVVSIIVNVLVKIQLIVIGIKSNSYSLFAFILTDLFYYTIVFVAILLTSSEVGEENSAPVLSVTKIAENGNISDWNFQQEIQLLLTKLNTPIMKMTGWNCFELNRSFMLTIMGALATYTIVVLQIT